MGANRLMDTNLLAPRLRGLYAANEAFRGEMEQTPWTRPAVLDSLRYVVQESAEVLSDWMKIHRTHARNSPADLNGELADLIMMALTALPDGWAGPDPSAGVQGFDPDDLIRWAADALTSYKKRVDAGSPVYYAYYLERILISCVFHAPGFDAEAELGRKFAHYRKKYKAAGPAKCAINGCSRDASIVYNGAAVCAVCYNDMIRDRVELERRGAILSNPVSTV